MEQWNIVEEWIVNMDFTNYKLNARMKIHRDIETGAIPITKSFCLLKTYL